MKERPHKLCISNTPQIAPPESAQGRNGRRRPLRERRRGRSPTRRPTSARARTDTEFIACVVIRKDNLSLTS